jgi:hypothetical protein
MSTPDDPVHVWVVYPYGNILETELCLGSIGRHVNSGYTVHTNELEAFRESLEKLYAITRLKHIAWKAEKRRVTKRRKQIEALEAAANHHD